MDLSKRSISTKTIVLNGLMIAMVFLGSYFTKIQGPLPPGFITFGDTIIMVAAVLLGKKTGFIAGAFGSVIVDLVSPGGLIFVPITFIVKGLEGYVCGAIAQWWRSKDLKHKISIPRMTTAVIASALVMVTGYFLGEAYILKIFDDTFGMAYALAEVPLNLIQGGVSAVVACILIGIFEKADVRQWIGR